MSKGRTLLSRQQFSDYAFARDRGCCVNCGEPGVDPHHIIERKLFNDQGFYLDNCAILCSECHHLAETTELSVETILRKAGIAKPVYPPHIPYDEKIDKWGNQILPNGMRMRGELFDDPGVQKALARGNMLGMFLSLYKYPRTKHFAGSQGVQSDDKMLSSVEAMRASTRIIGSIKKDGENSTLYNNVRTEDDPDGLRTTIHARSVDGRSHESRDWLKQFHNTIGHNIPERWRVCGENLFAVHSIRYEELPTYFYGFSVWDDRNVALSWDDTLVWFELIGITPVEVVYDGVFDEAAMQRTAEEVIASGEEGMVYRTADEIPYREFSDLVGKFVRKGHVQTSDHWMHGAIERNGLRREPRNGSPSP
jgi:hypothetical protein